MNSYRALWLLPQGAAYRRATYQRQRAGGAQPLIDNPSVDQIAAALAAHRPKTVLEVGCGWGRLLAPLHDRFCIEGCDASPDMIALCPSRLNVFRWDICADGPPPRRWDVVFSRGVFQYFNGREVRRAMHHVSAAAASAVHIWEWPDVCGRMRRIAPSDKFCFHEIQKRDE